MLADTEEVKISFDMLERGALYPITHIERTESKFYGKTVNGIKVNVDDDGTSIVTYLPKKLVDAIDDAFLKQILDAASANTPFCLCYYGKTSTKQIETFIGRIHPHGQARFERLYVDIGKIMTKYNVSNSAVKREAAEDADEMNPKKPKQQ